MNWKFLYVLLEMIASLVLSFDKLLFHTNPIVRFYEKIVILSLRFPTPERYGKGYHNLKFEKKKNNF